MYSKTIINIMIHNKEEVLSNFSSNSLLLSPDFKKFLETKLNLRYYKDSITLNFICEDILKNEEERYFNAVHETYEECYEEARYQAKKLLITSIIMFSIGVLILGLALLFEYLNKNSLLLEVYDIIAWVFVWDAVDVFVFRRSRLNQQKIRYKILKNVDIVFNL